MPKTRVIEIFLDNTFEDKKISYDGNKLKPRKKETVEFEPICVLKKRTKRSFFSWLPFERRKNSLILFVNKAHKALRFGAITEELQALWSKKEAREFVKKEIAKAHMEQKPMTWTQFFIILGVNVATLFMMLVIAQRLRLF